MLTTVIGAQRFEVRFVRPDYKAGPDRACPYPPQRIYLLPYEEVGYIAYQGF